MPSAIVCSPQATKSRSFHRLQAADDMRSTLVDRPIEPSDLLAEVARTSNGATVLFVGTVREVNEGRPVAGIEYSAYRSMAECEMAEIVGEASQRFGTRDIVVEHRLGALEL